MNLHFDVISVYINLLNSFINEQNKLPINIFVVTAFTRCCHVTDEVDY